MISPMISLHHRSTNEGRVKPARTPPSAACRVSASELAQMGICEKRVVFEQRYGRRRTLVQLEALRRGLRAHQRFLYNGCVETADRRPRLIVTTTTHVRHRRAMALRGLLAWWCRAAAAIRLALRLIRGLGGLRVKGPGRDDGG